MNKTSVWKGVEALSLALIFAPEPFTTPVGIMLLAYARKKHKEEQEAAKTRYRPRNSFTDYYHYRVGMARGSSITYHVSPIKQGQLPLARSTISRLYENRREWEYFYNTLNARGRLNLTRPNPFQPAGLLKTPFIRYRTTLPPQKDTPQE
jgi:hypothetical protein